MKSVLTIAGFDPSSGAGATADLMVFAAFGLFGTSCLTSLTVQSTLGVVSTHPVSPSVIVDSLQILASDLPPTGIKVGMLGSSSAVAAVIDFIGGLRDTPGNALPVVLDPVLRSSSGGSLLAAKGLQLLLDQLLPLVDFVTPNLDELALLTGQPRADRRRLLSQAQLLQESVKSRSGGRIAVLAKGGHLTPPEQPDDLLLTGEGTHHWLPGEYIETTATHGTGCALSSALLARLVLGDSPLQAATAAKLYVAEAMRSATPLGHGAGPLNHLWPLCRG